jgi:2-amino-4-hydroxy-6-hydroxymethyldihydropteridine diphosphokinase
MTVPRIFIGVGANLGDRREAIIDALNRFATQELNVLGKSSLYETSPYGRIDQNNFLNAVVLCETELDPHEVHRRLKHIEREMGRLKRERWGPREIDLDLLLYGDLVMNEKNLIVPHPDLANRPFVLVPLDELEPSIVHPVLSKKPGELLDDLRASHKHREGEVLSIVASPGEY